MKAESSRKQIVIFRLGPIGDIVNVVPLIKYLKVSFTDIEIIYVCEPQYFPIVSRIAGIDKIHICDIEKDLRSEESIAQMADELVSKYDVSTDSEFVLLHLAEPFGLLAKKLKIKKVFVYSNRRFWFSQLNLWKRFLQTYKNDFDFKSINESELIPLFEKKNIQAIEEKLRAHGIDVRKNLIAFIPGVGSNLPHKAWPIENWVELAKLVIAKDSLNASVLILGSEKERNIIQEISQKLTSNSVHNLTGIFHQDELVDLVSIMKSCVGADSGAVHIASGMGVPTICLFGPTSAIKHSPINASILQGKCSFICKLQKKCVQKPEKRCMRQISTNEVFQIICKNLAQEAC
jgi:heptosyltransferase-3